MHTHAADAHHARTQQARESGCCKERGDDPSGGGCCGGRSIGQHAELVHQPATAQQMMEFPTLPLVMRFRKGIENIDQRIFSLTERQIDTAFVPEAGVGRWPVRVLLGHLADAEIVFVHRMRRCVGEVNPVVGVWDENAFIDSGIYEAGEKRYADDEEADHARVMRILGGYLATIHTMRQWAGNWLLGLDESAWSRTIMHPERGVQTLKTIVAYDTWHLEHHAQFLTKKLDRMGVKHEQESGGEGCCGGGGSGCGCGC